MRIESAILWMCLSFVGGYILSNADHAGKDAVMEQFQSWNRQDQQDFILSVVSDKATLRREIAEDWCAINKQTQRVCWNAKMNHPIRGVK